MAKISPLYFLVCWLLKSTKTTLWKIFALYPNFHFTKGMQGFDLIGHIQKDLKLRDCKGSRDRRGLRRRGAYAFLTVDGFGWIFSPKLAWNRGRRGCGEYRWRRLRFLYKVTKWLIRCSCKPSAQQFFSWGPWIVSLPSLFPQLWVASLSIGLLLESRIALSTFYIACCLPFWWADPKHGSLFYSEPWY